MTSGNPLDTDAIAARLALAHEWQAASDAVRAEMAERAYHGDLCRNEQMPSWPRYVSAVKIAPGTNVLGGDIAALLAEVARLRTELDRMTILYTSRFPK